MKENLCSQTCNLVINISTTFPIRPLENNRKFPLLRESLYYYINQVQPAL